MSSSMVTKLPLELLLEIGRDFSFEDKRRLSCVSRDFRQYYAPQLYSKIRFSNRLADQDAIASVVTKYGYCARALVFVVDLSLIGWEFGEWKSGDQRLLSEDDDTEAEVAMDGLPHLARDILRGKILPGIPSLTIRVTADPNSEVGWLHWNAWRRLRNENLALGESRALWRRCLTAMWQALAENPRPVSHLALPNLMPVMSSAWLTPAWSVFIGQLESLSIGLWDSKWIFDASPPWHRGKFDLDMDAHFWRHATALRRLELVPSPCNFYAFGTYSMEGSPASLHELRVANAVVSDELAQFIGECVKSGVKGVELANCVAIDSYTRCGKSPGFGSPWHSFFGSIASRIQGREGPWDVFGFYSNEMPPVAVPEQRGVTIALEEFTIMHESGILFPYAYDDLKSGVGDYRAFLEGNKDAIMYQGLMDLIRQNRTRATAI
ncbi:amidase signature domain-containing protein [Apiospora arundinis]